MNYPDFQIDWLRAFVAVVDAGSLSGAAPLVHRSQSAVSMQIKKLETALGRPVLLRGPRTAKALALVSRDESLPKYDAPLPQPSYATHGV